MKKIKPVKKVALILAPIMPKWDGGDFCKLIATLLQEKGLEPSIVDTLSYVQEADPEKVVATLVEQIKKIYGSPFLLVGFAMGGTLAQMLAQYIQPLGGLLTFSAPGYVDQPLKERLEKLIILLQQKNCKKRKRCFIVSFCRKVW